MALKLFGSTDIGLVRERNEDSFIALGENEITSALDAILVVADGMGGHASGDVASSITVKHLESKLRVTDRYPVGYSATENYLQSLLKEANQKVYEAGQVSVRSGMGTTCTLVALKGQTLYYSHVGDSRAYLYRDSELTQITHDHSWVGRAVDMGTLTKEEARMHTDRNVITRAIGLSPDVEVDSGRLSIAPGDIVLVCSDGLNSMLSDDEITEVLKNTPVTKLCEQMISHANGAGGDDNTTVVVAQV